MRQLNEHEAGFLYSDTVHSNANISFLSIYDQSTAPGGKVRFKSILTNIAGRLDRSPLFRQKLLRVPFDLDHPYWVEDEHFDLEYHVRHIALPKPGDWRQFCIQASRIHARALDLNRPLWELYVIEGLDSFLDLPVGSFALLIKTHLAAVDVARGNALMMMLHDATARPPEPPPPAPWFADAPPGRLTMAARSLHATLREPWRLAQPLTRALARVAPAALSLAGEQLLHPGDAPVTRFNSVVSPHRVFDTRRFTVEEFSAISRLVDGASLNDAVLAVCGGALRRYLETQAELPQQSLAAIAPQVLAADGVGNADAWQHVRLGSDLADPVERLAMIHRQTAGAQVASDARPERWSIATLLGLQRRSTPLANCSITSVPGPAMPLYLCGAHMTYTSAILPISDGTGLVMAVTIYDGRVVISPTSCRELLPDPEAFTQALRDTFQEYLALARSRSPATPTRAKAAKPATGRAKAGAVKARVKTVPAKGRAKPAAAVRVAATRH
jgi:diacylglycerol O-acyltransferase / wax synthase